MGLNLANHTSNLMIDLQGAISTDTRFYLVPFWLDETLKAYKRDVSVLVDQQALKTILTGEDVAFYNKQLEKLNFFFTKRPVGFLKSIYFNYIYYENNASCLNYGIESNPVGELENSISLKDAFEQIMNPSCGELPGDSSRLLVSFEIKKRVKDNINVIGVRFSYTNDMTCADNQEEYDKLAEFFISEYGISEFAKSELFKIIL